MLPVMSLKPNGKESCGLKKKKFSITKSFSCPIVIIGQMSIEKREVAVFGAGLSGLSVAKGLGSRGRETVVFASGGEEKPRSVYSKNLAAWPDVFPPELMKKLSVLRAITLQEVDVTVDGHGCYSVIDYPRIIRRMEAALGSSVQVERYPLSILQMARLEEKQEGVEVKIDGSRVIFDRVIDASGPGAFASRQVEPEREPENPLVEYVYGGKYRGYLDQEAMVLIFGPAGGTCWACPSVEEEGSLDVVFSAWGWENHFPQFLSEADKRLAVLVDFLKGKSGFQFDRVEPEVVFSGVIRASRTFRSKANFVYAVGEAAGVALPGTGDSARGAVASGRLAGETIWDSTPAQLHRQLSSRSGFGLFEGMTLARLPYQQRGELGQLVDIVGERIAQGELRPVIKRAVEHFLTEGEIRPMLWPIIMGNLKILRFLLESVLAERKYRLSKGKLPQPFDTLPKI